MSEQGSPQAAPQESGGNLQGILIGVAAVLAVIIVVLFVLFQNAQGDLNETRENATVVAQEAATSAARADSAQAQATEAAATAAAAGTAQANAESAQATAESAQANAESAQATAQAQATESANDAAAASTAQATAESAQATAESAQATAESAQDEAESQANAAQTAAAEREATAEVLAADLDTANAAATASAADSATRQAAASATMIALANAGEQAAGTATAAADFAATSAALATISVATSDAAFATGEARAAALATDSAQAASTATAAADFAATQGARATQVVAQATAAATSARATLDAERRGFAATLTAIAPQPSPTAEPGGAGPDADAPGTLPTPAPDSQVIITEVLGRGDINAETVVIQNNGSTVNLNGWTLSDSAGSTYTFEGDFRLFSGGQVLIFTRSGDDTPIARYWNRTDAVFGEAGDAVILRDAEGEVQAVLPLNGASADTDGLLTAAEVPVQTASLPDGSFVFDYPQAWWGAVELPNGNPPATAVLNVESVLETVQQQNSPRAGETWVIMFVLQGGPDATAESILQDYITRNLEDFALTPITQRQITGFDGNPRAIAYADIVDGDGRLIMVELGDGNFAFLDAFSLPQDFDVYMPEYMVIAASIRPN